MYYNHQLRSNLQEWKDQLYKSDFSDFTDNFLFFYEKLLKEPILENILSDVIQEYPISNEEIEAWMKQLTRNKTEYVSLKHKISYLIHFALYFYDRKKTPTHFIHVFSGTPREKNSSFLDRVITPIVNYLHESLDNISYLLYILEKYKLRTEWFTKDVLKERYNKVSNRQYEQVFEDDIRLHLFDQGIDYPFSTPKSASGRADVISLVNTEDPLVMEIKIYDSVRGYKKDRIIGGFNQVVKYANDYHKNVGYLVVFNLDNIEIEIENIEPDNKWPNRVNFNGKTYYIIIINLNYDVSASKQKSIDKITLSFKELTSSM